MKINILLVSSGLIHPNWLARRRFSALLAEIPGFNLHQVPTLESLLTFPLENTAGIVLYIHHERISPPALERLESFVASGGGLAALHSASASFKTEKRFFELLGGRFTGHGPVKEFRVLPAPTASATFSGIEGFDLRDELYHHEYDSSSQVQFYTPENNVNEPVAWTRSHSLGRVFYCSLGHTAETLLLPGFRTLFKRGLEWSVKQDPADSGGDR